MWLPPLNSHETYKTIILATQDDRPAMDVSSSEKVFLIRVDVDVSFYSKSNQLALNGLFLSEQFTFPCCLLTCTSKEYVKKVVSKILRDMQVPFELDHILFTHRHLIKRSCNKRFTEEDSDSWINKLKDFFSLTRSETHNANYNVLPLKLKIMKIVWISDDEFLAWRSWYNEKRRVDPNFEIDYQAAVCRPRTIPELLDEVNFKPAEESSLAALLQEATLDDDDDSSSTMPMQCLVCLEEFFLGPEACRLPCSHVFHKACITKWLQESNMCPLCRTSLPSV